MVQSRLLEFTMMRCFYHVFFIWYDYKRVIFVNLSSCFVDNAIVYSRHRLITRSYQRADCKYFTRSTICATLGEDKKVCIICSFCIVVRLSWTCKLGTNMHTMYFLYCKLGIKMGPGILEEKPNRRNLKICMRIRYRSMVLIISL